MICKFKHLNIIKYIFIKNIIKIFKHIYQFIPDISFIRFGHSSGQETIIILLPLVFLKLPLVEAFGFSTSSGTLVSNSLKLEQKLWCSGARIMG